MSSQAAFLVVLDFDPFLEPCYLDSAKAMGRELQFRVAQQGKPSGSEMIVLFCLHATLNLAWHRNADSSEDLRDVTFFVLILYTFIAKVHKSTPFSCRFEEDRSIRRIRGPQMEYRRITNMRVPSVSLKALPCIHVIQTGLEQSCYRAFPCLHASSSNVIMPLLSPLFRTLRLCLMVCSRPAHTPTFQERQKHLTQASPCVPFHSLQPCRRQPVSLEPDKVQ